MATSVTQLSLLNAANSPSPVASNHPDLSSYDHIIVMFSGGKDSLACLLHVHTLLESINQTHKLELWHHLVDGNEGSLLMDWACTSAYCKAIAKEFCIPLYFSWLRGGFEGEMMRVNAAKQPTWFQSPDGLHCAGGNSPKLGTRLKFPQVSADLRVRWCSSSLKIDVGAIALNNQPRFIGKRTLVISGERAEESPGRARYPAFEQHRSHAKKRHCDHWRPVHGWTYRQVWRIIAKHRINPHPSYRLGFARVSCQFCIFGSDNQWATLHKIDPARLQVLADYELKFGLTIHRTQSISARVNRGKPYPNLAQSDITAALSSEWSEPIRLPPGAWSVPPGYHGEASGPS